MAPPPPSISPEMPVAELAAGIAHREPRFTARQSLPVVDASGKMVGIMTRSNLLAALEMPEGAVLNVGDVCGRNVIVAYPDEVLYEAVERMLQNSIGRLPVVERDNPAKVIGYLGRAEILAARLRRIEEERVRETGWVGKIWKNA
jgi:CBS domain-containing protein